MALRALSNKEDLGFLNGIAASRPSSEAPSVGPCGGLAAMRLGFAAEPVVNLIDQDASILYSECLARVRTADGAIHMPGHFVDYLESVRAIDLLDIAIVNMVAQALADHPGLRLGCNVSALTVNDVGAWSKVIDAISSHGRGVAERLTLEITETQELSPKSGIGRHLDEVRSQGCRLAMDDFGLGFSQQSYLQEIGFEWDLIKIDRSCFKAELADVDVCSHIKSKIMQASSFAKHVVVEGIETSLHLELARSAGAEYGQGWLFPTSAALSWSNEPSQLLKHVALALNPAREPANAT